MAPAGASTATGRSITRAGCHGVRRHRALYPRYKDTNCAAVCPVSCFHEGPNCLATDPDECIDYDIRVPECPVDAIFPEEGLSRGQERFIALNAMVAPAWPMIEAKKGPPPDAKDRGRGSPTTSSIWSAEWAPRQGPARPAHLVEVTGRNRELREPNARIRETVFAGSVSRGTKGRNPRSRAFPGTAPTTSLAPTPRSWPRPTDAC
jgi:ferredoxin